MKIDIRFDENMNRPKYFVTKKKPNKKIEIFEIRTEATKQLDFVIISYAYSIENADCIKNLVNDYRRESKCLSNYRIDMRYCQMLWIEVWIGIGLSDFLQHLRTLLYTILIWRS